MSKDDVLKFIESVLGSFRYHSLLLSELLSLIAETGAEKQIFNLLLARIHQLTALNINAPKLAEFENLGDGLFSMHLSGKNFNIRILYAFLPNRQPVFLLAFYEREKKKNTDYSTYLPPAKERLNTMKEDYNNEYA